LATHSVILRGRRVTHRRQRRRFRSLTWVLPRLYRAPWLLVVSFVALGVVSGMAVESWPQHVPWTLYALIVVAAGIFLEPRPLIVVYVGVAVTIVYVGAVLGDRKGATLGTSAATLAIMLLMLWLAGARARAGVVGISGESMLVDMRDRLRAQGELPPLPEGWEAETALESAYGDSFAGDFVVATRSTDGRMLEIALVDVSGKGRNAGTRSLLLSGALGGLLGEMSERGFLSSANNHLLRLRWPEGFATAVHVAIDLETGAFTIGYAGHPAAAQFFAGSGRWQMLSGGRGPLLGVIDVAE
jgi:hypothetical protein